MSNTSNDFVKGVLIGTIFGGIAGAITALLLAPKSGEEFRKDLSEKSQELYGKASEYLNVVEDKVGGIMQTTVNEGKIKAQNMIDSARRQADDLISNAETILKDARTKASQTKETIGEKISNVKDAAKAGAEAFRTELNSTNQ